VKQEEGRNCEWGVRGMVGRGFVPAEIGPSRHPTINLDATLFCVTSHASSYHQSADFKHLYEVWS